MLKLIIFYHSDICFAGAQMYSSVNRCKNVRSKFEIGERAQRKANQASANNFDLLFFSLFSCATKVNCSIQMKMNTTR